MEALLKTLLLGSHGAMAYLSIFSVLVACGLGIPLPEDIALILGGFLVYKGVANLWIMVAVGFCGILVGDSLIYLAGRRVGRRVRTGHGWLARVVTPARRIQVEGLFARHGEKIVIAARFMPGVRAVTYFTAGSAVMPFARFICFDGLAALVSAPLFVLLGYRFGRHLQQVIELMKRYQLIAAGVLLGGVLLWAAIHRWREISLARKIRAQSGEQDRKPPPGAVLRGPAGELNE
ncbi:MAG TPA: DedA family protein [Myxococcaceae bacterium]|nr:DedA family protein [Myxococcaceae bacterium]